MKQTIMLNKKQFIFAYIAMLYPLSLYSSPINLSTMTYYKDNLHLPPRIIQPIQKHPKKACTGGLFTFIGLCYMHSGLNTTQMTPETKTGQSQKNIGNFLVAIGTAFFIPIIWDMIFPTKSDTEKTDPLKIPDKK